MERTPEMIAADEEIEASFQLTWDEIRASQRLDKYAAESRMPLEERERIAQRRKAERERYRRNKEKIAAQKKEYYQSHREACLARVKAYRDSHREERARKERERMRRKRALLRYEPDPEKGKPERGNNAEWHGR